ncbi:MAG TPA: hypothetical protein VEF76_00370 [Patescibacteria group bacterium]|nr:hypothetical protein [Patescibacteria group bacterium]
MAFTNPLKKFFYKAKDTVQSQETHTYVRFFTESGAHYAEVQDRDISKLTLPEDTHHFKFFDRTLKKGEKPDTRTLYAGAENVSPTHYVVDKVMTAKAFKALPEEEKQKLGEVNLEASLVAYIAVIGSEVKPLTRDENYIAIDKRTLKQLFPPVEAGPSSSLKNAPKR